jgi:hypothetical protein
VGLVEKKSLVMETYGPGKTVSYVATKIAVFFNFDPFFLLFPNGLEDLYEMYPEKKEESQKLMTSKRKAG